MTATWTEREKQFKAAYDAVERRCEDGYGVPVKIGDCKDPFTGDFNGAEIQLDHSLDLDMALFVLGHLFGHTAQWVTDDGLRDLGMRYASSAPPEADRARVRAYEADASRLALALFHEAGVHDLDGWLSDWAAADWAYLDHFYRTGTRGQPRSFYRPNVPLLTPLAIPRFTPKRFESRQAF